jgi:hypothetical protein
VASVLVGGVVADRASRRAVMVAADLVRVASQGAMAALLIAGAADVWMLALLAGVTGTATGFFSPASTGLLPEVVTRRAAAAGERAALERGLGGRESSARCRGAAGRSRRSGVGDRGRRRDVRGERGVPGDAAHPGARRAAQPSSFVADLREGWVAFRSRRWVWTVVGYFAIGNLLWGAWSALGPVVADRDLGGAAAWGTGPGGDGRGGAGRQPARHAGQRRAGRWCSSPSPTGSSRCPWASWRRPRRCALLAFGALLSGRG